MPFEQITSRLAVLHIRGELVGDRAKLLRGRRHEQEVAIGNLVELRGRLDPPVKADAGEIDAVAMRLVDVDQGLEFVSPDQHVAARPAAR